MEALESFLNLVREYVALIEDRENLTPYEILRRCDSLLPEIYIEALRLPKVEPDTTGVDQVDVKSPYRELKAIFGVYDIYNCFFDPSFDRKPCVGSLADDLADIYRDLKTELLAYKEGRQNDAIWGWCFGLQSHYGRHITSAMSAIHPLVHDHMDRDYVNQGTRDEESQVKVLDIGFDGIKLKVEDEELFIPYIRFQRFEDALLGGIFHVLKIRPGRLYWPDLGIDLEIQSLRRS
jgi:hypothetical protein